MYVQLKPYIKIKKMYNYTADKSLKHPLCPVAVSVLLSVYAPKSTTKLRCDIICCLHGSDGLHMFA